MDLKNEELPRENPSDPQPESFVDLTDDNGIENEETQEDISAQQLCRLLDESVTVYDYLTLADGEFLNDSIINFYLLYLYSKLSEPLKESIHIFSSHFYTSLKGNSKMDKKDKQKHMTKAEKSYLRVKAWTRKMDIFSKRMLVLPICEDWHWYLVVVCNHGMVLSAKRTKDFEEKREEQQKLESMGGNPFIMVLDSIEGTHSSAVNKIRSYLQFEHLERKGFPLNYGSEKMLEKCPLIPLQSNTSDCGVYLLHYAELIFQNPHQFLGAKLPDLSKWFSLTEILNKRQKISDDIKLLAQSQNVPLDKFPSIKFPSSIEGNESSEGEASPSPTVEQTKSQDPRLNIIRAKSFPGEGSIKSTSQSLGSNQLVKEIVHKSTACPEKKRFKIDPGDRGKTIERADEMFRELMKYTKASK